MIRNVLVTDGEQRSALAAVRALGRRGHHVFVCSKNGRSIAGASRYATTDRRAPSPLSDPAGFARVLRALIEEWRIEVLLPMSEEAFNAIFAHPEVLDGVCLPAAGARQFNAVSDKQKVLEVAKSLGISVPSQRALITPADASTLSAGATSFPVVVKPARSVNRDGTKQSKRGAIHCRDQNELSTALGRFSASSYPLLIQQRVVGEGIGVFMLVWDGEVAASFGHRRIREKPPAGGVSVYRESVAVDPGLLERSRLLLAAFGWRGVAMIEYKIEESTGTPYLMEINGRFWGSLQLAIDAGVDFPSLLLARASGERAFGPKEYRLGVRSRWEWGNVDYLLARLRYSNKELAIPPGSGGRVRAILDAMVPWSPGDRLEVFRFGDPAPFLRESVQYFLRS